MIAGLGLIGDRNFVEVQDKLSSHPAVSSGEMRQDYWKKTFNEKEKLRNPARKAKKEGWIFSNEIIH
jgi:hypothetical protein